VSFLWSLLYSRVRFALSLGKQKKCSEWNTGTRIIVIKRIYRIKKKQFNFSVKQKKIRADLFNLPAGRQVRVIRVPLYCLVIRVPLY